MSHGQEATRQACPRPCSAETGAGGGSAGARGHALAHSYFQASPCPRLCPANPTRAAFQNPPEASPDTCTSGPQHRGPTLPFPGPCSCDTQAPQQAWPLCSLQRTAAVLTLLPPTHGLPRADPASWDQLGPPPSEGLPGLPAPLPVCGPRVWARPAAGQNSAGAASRLERTDSSPTLPYSAA